MNVLVVDTLYNEKWRLQAILQKNAIKYFFSSTLHVVPLFTFASLPLLLFIAASTWSKLWKKKCFHHGPVWYGPRPPLFHKMSVYWNGLYSKATFTPGILFRTKLKKVWTKHSRCESVLRYTSRDPHADLPQKGLRLRFNNKTLDREDCGIWGAFITWGGFISFCTNIMWWPPIQDEIVLQSDFRADGCQTCYCAKMWFIALWKDMFEACKIVFSWQPYGKQIWPHPFAHSQS